MSAFICLTSYRAYSYGGGYEQNVTKYLLRVKLGSLCFDNLEPTLYSV